MQGQVRPVTLLTYLVIPVFPMARISSPFDLSGTYGNLVVYQVGCKLYARTKSSLTGKRFRKDPAFIKSGEKAVQFGEAARLAKTIYATLPKAVKKKGVFGKLTGLVHQGLHNGKTKETIIQAVQQYVGIAPMPKPIKAVRSPIQALRRKSLPLLSRWQVTPEGKLQLFTPSLRRRYQIPISIRGA